MKDDAVIKDNEAVYLINEQTYLHLREKSSRGSGMRSLTKTARSRWRKDRFHGKFWATVSGASETARAYYLAEHQDEPVERSKTLPSPPWKSFAPGFANAGIWLHVLCRKMMCVSSTRSTMSCSGAGRRCCADDLPGWASTLRGKGRIPR